MKLKLVELTVTLVVIFLALLVSLSATYNAYLLRGGKLALSEVLIALGMVSLVVSLVAELSLPQAGFVLGMSAADPFLILGFVLLLVASLKLRSSIR